MWVKFFCAVQFFFFFLYRNISNIYFWFLVDGFKDMERPAIGGEGLVPPNANLWINLELVSWKITSNITKNKNVYASKG